MDKLLLFIDGSVSAKTKVGYGAYLLIDGAELKLEAVKSQVQLRRFEDTSSTKLELRTLIWALSEIEEVQKKVKVFTDSQNIVSLKTRRSFLEENDYRTKTSKILTNHELYRDFFKQVDRLDCEFVKLKGHKPSEEKDEFDLLFTLVDQACRRALRKEMKS
ncbi:MAG: ribonuclease H [Cyclobacteriaceae bacterium]